MARDRPTVDDATAGPRLRDASIDVARGIAIVAIVLGHVLRGASGAGLLDPESTLAVVADRTLYLFHLAVFAFLSGLFVRAGIEGRGARSFLRSRLVGFAYLYVVWSLIQGAVKLATASAVNRPTGVLDVLNLAVPEGQLWFLPWLMIASVVAALTRPYRSAATSMAVLLPAAGLAVAMWGSDFGVLGGQGLALYVFYLAGVVVGSGRYRRLLARTPVALLAAVCGVAVVVVLLVGLSTHATVPTSYFASRDPLRVAAGIAGSVAGVAMVLTGSALLARLPAAAAVLGGLGRGSLEIFLAHIVFAAGARIALVRLGIEDPLVIVPACLLVGVAGPMLLAVTARRLRFPWLFEAPAWLTGKRSPTPAT